MLPNGMMVNPDTEFVRGLRKRIKQNNGYCVCKVEKTPDNKCPCKDLRENGECCCGLYVKDISDLIDREALFEGYV